MAISSDVEDTSGLSRSLPPESDAEEALLSDYLLFIAITAVSFVLIGFGAIKLLEIF